ncbi:MAG: DNA polymerase III subunits gamma and tau [Burkholderiaceae bacterium]|jgi:DNA polymerase-3 subunit gamma/tau|nr:MAG: DNA polymerase III subunits gamma and tau [Burkholderiaceae bacterium]
MSYLVLARKYRPRTFAELVGQEHVVQALSNALATQRLHHAYLFTGTRGVGKTTVSRILAKSLNCTGPDGKGNITASPCGVCQSCSDIDSGRFVDYTELDAASNRGVDEIQTLLEQAVYKPVQGRFKVFMIDEVHMLTGHAFNAMLKTLEEPPEYLKFVLATTDPQKVPVTVLSRCLQFNLRPMAPEVVQHHLEQVLLQEDVAAEAPALRLLARAARGSMRDALSLTDQAIAYGNGRIEEAGVRAMLGSADRGHVLRLIEALARGDGRAVVDTCDELRVQGLSGASTLEEMSAVLQRIAVCQAVPDAAGALADDPDAQDAARLAALLPADETQLLYSICLHGRAELGLAPDEYAALTMVLLRLLAFKPATPKREPTGLAAEKKTSPELATTRKAPVPPTAAASAASPPGLRLPLRDAGISERKVVDAPDPSAEGATETIAIPVRLQSEPGDRTQPRAGAEGAADFEPSSDGDFWHALVQQLIDGGAVAALVRELALQSQLVARDTGHWMLRVERESLNQPANRERLRAALAAAGHAVDLSVEVGAITDSPARRIAAAEQRRQRAAEATILGDPFVQSMMRDFGAKIVPGSIKPI